MIDTERVKEAESKVKNYLEEKLLWKYGSYQKDIFNTYLRNYQDSLEVAQKLFEQNLSPLWIIVISYYSMYYIANAVLYKIGYKVGGKISHKVTADALIVFIRNKLKKELLEEYEEAREEALEIVGKKADEIISSFDKELEKRSIFQYESTEEIRKGESRNFPQTGQGVHI